MRTSVLQAPAAIVAPPQPHDPARARRAPESRARLDAAVRLAAGSALWLSLLLLATWWVADGGVQELGEWPRALTSMGRLTALFASGLLLAQVLLMARVPLLERAFGQDRLARLHRLTGLSSFSLLMAHIALITLGYAGGSLLQAPATLWNLTWDYPGMLLAVAGAGCLTMVVATSVRAARRRLRYESWHLLHLYAYLGVGLALPHQLWTGEQFLASTARTVFWWTAWGLVAGSVLVWRLGLPAWRSLRHRLVVTSVVPEADGVVSVYLTGRRMDRLRVEAGQFLNWRFVGTPGAPRPGRSRAHPYSLSAAPDGRSLRITVQARGDGSADVARLEPGARAWIEGPYGRLTPRARTRDRVVLIGAGVGIAPLRALAEGLDYRPGEAVVLHRHTAAPLFAREWGALSAERGLRVLDLPGRRRAPDSWLGSGTPSDPAADDLTVLLSWVPELLDSDVYVCGPLGWMALVRRTLEAAGLANSQLHFETFDW